MNSKLALLCVLPLVVLLPLLRAADVAPTLDVTVDQGIASVHWRMGPSPLMNRLQLRLQRSSDLKTWENHGPKVRLASGAAAQGILISEPTQPQNFFRATASDAFEFSGTSGEAVLGYVGALADELPLVRNISPAELADRYPLNTPYLPQLTWDPTTARYWEGFNQLWPGNFTSRIAPYDLRLNQTEIGLLKTNGFIVVERLGRGNFSDQYYDIFIHDLPVFITADSILHAWHRSFDAILEDLEINRLKPELQRILSGMTAAIPELSKKAQGPMLDGLKDADYVLAVANRLLTETASPQFPENETRVTDTLTRIKARYAGPFQWLWGTGFADFSLMIPRGHYAESADLTRYFQTMTWCGLSGMVVGGTNSTPRQVAASLATLALARKSGSTERFATLDGVLTRLVGPADSMSLGQLAALSDAAHFNLESMNLTAEQLSGFSHSVLDGGFGFQQVAPIGLPPTGHSHDQRLIPRFFALFGQRFTLDAWAMQEMLWPRISPELTGTPGDIRRRRSTCLDVAFSVLGNSQVLPDLLANMANPGGVPFRDGFPYTHKLAAVRAVIDQQPITTWSDTLYGSWLYALRSLSSPTTGPEYPEAMRTRAWANKTLNTQMGSWSQLRHDTVLYVKQTLAGPVLCYYPYAFVEPRPEFFERMGGLATQLRQIAESLGTNWVAPGSASGLQTFLSRFSDRCATLKAITLKELAQQPLSTNETSFLGDLVERQVDYFGMKTYKGWYPLMFYRGAEGAKPCTAVYPQICPDHDSALDDLIVADVQTDGPSEPDADPGAVLQEGLGRVNYMLVAVDSGPDRMLFAGPVFSHYEFWSPYGRRLTDTEWRNGVNNVPPRPIPPPPWTQLYLR